MVRKINFRGTLASERISEKEMKELNTTVLHLTTPKMISIWLEQVTNLQSIRSLWSSEGRSRRLVPVMPE
jgi:hypothetical protein